MMKRLMGAVATLCATAAFAFTEPIYTITTSGEGTNDITAATIEVTENGTTTTKSFSDISFTFGTILKRGTGFLQSNAGLSNFTGTIVVAEGVWLATANGHLGRSVVPPDISASVVISNGASVKVAIPAGSTGQFRQSITFGGTGYNGMGAICVENKVASIDSLFWNTRWTMTDDATIAYHNTTSTFTAGYIVTDMQGHTLTLQGYGNGTGSTFYQSYPTFLNPGHSQVRQGETLEDFNQNRHLLVQIESPVGIRALPDMLDAYGDEIAAIVIGPYDLSFTMNMPTKFDDPQFQAAVKKIFDICNSRGKSVGIFCDSAEQARKYREMGANFMWMCTDDQIVKAGLRSVIAPLAQ